MGNFVFGEPEDARERVAPTWDYLGTDYEKIRRGEASSEIPSRLCQYLRMRCTYIAAGKWVPAETSVAREKFSSVLCFTKDCLRLYFTQIYTRARAEIRNAEERERHAIPQVYVSRHREFRYFVYDNVLILRTMLP